MYAALSSRAGRTACTTRGRRTRRTGFSSRGCRCWASATGCSCWRSSWGARVGPGREREFGPATISASGSAPLLAGLPSELHVWMSHGDPYRGDAARVRIAGYLRKLPGGRHGGCRAGLLRAAVPPRGSAYATRGRIDRELRTRCVPGGGGLDAGQLRPGNGVDHPRAGRRRAGDLRPLGRRRQRRGGDARAPRYRRPADLHLRRQRAVAGRGKRRRWSSPSSAT